MEAYGSEREVSKHAQTHGSLECGLSPRWVQYICIYAYIPVVPHKAVAEVSKI